MNKPTTAFAVAMVLLTAVVPMRASSAGFMDGNQLLARCKENAPDCLGYVGGVVDAIELLYG